MNVYPKLIELIKAGARLSPDAVAAILAACGRDWRDLAVDAVLRPRSPQPGDRCESCGRTIQVVNTISTADHRTQYLGCRHCGWRPPRNKRLIATTVATPSGMISDPHDNGK